jgi:serine/threonine protein kinase/formylglycine-generating enzyme required for sulfatase activity
MPPGDLPQNVFDRLLDCLGHPPERRSAALEKLQSEYPEYADAMKAWLDNASLARHGRDIPTTDLWIGGTMRRESWLSAGSTFGPYLLQKRLGEGAQGVVFLAVDTRSQEQHAVKVLRDFDRNDPRFLERFEREVAIATKLRHPNLCRVHEGGILEGTPYIVMDYVHGETLHERNQREREASWAGDRTSAEFHPQPIADKIRCIEALLRGVHAMHEAGIVHRDIKPANIVVRQDGSAVLMDFGLARDESLRTLTKTGDLLGTPAYMSPEQLTFSAIKLDRRTDIWSMGAVLYEYLTLERPFEAPTRDALYRMILTKEPTEIRRLNRAVPADMRTVIETALEKDRDRRFVSALVFAEELQRVLDGEALLVRPISTATRLRRWASRNPAAALGITVSLTLLLAGTMVSSLFWYRASNNLAEWNRLADARKLEDLIASANEGLWPAIPGKIRALRAWLQDAEGLYAHLPEHITALEAIRTRGRLQTAVPSHPAFLFEDAIDQFKHDKLADLVERMRLFGQGQSSFEVNLDAVRDRLQLAESLQRRLANEDRIAWDTCRKDLARSDSIYAGLTLEPLPGLVPLGWDQESGLWEFWHIASGSRPHWEGQPLGAGRASLAADDSGIVLILLPAREFTMGAEQGSGPPGLEALENEAPPRRVALDAFFISKWEVSQGQWNNQFGRNPSHFRPGADAVSVTLRHPATDMNLPEAETSCRRWDLEVPTEAQWEFACRAGTVTPFAFGSSAKELVGAINIADHSANGFNGVQPVESWDDTYPVHAPVDAFKPNAFGILNMHGNVWEWCRDPACDYRSSVPRAGDGLRAASAPTPEVILRGGGYFDIATRCRSTFRFVWPSSNPHAVVGLRPVRYIRKPH